MGTTVAEHVGVEAQMKKSGKSIEPDSAFWNTILKIGVLTRPISCCSGIIVKAGERENG